MISGNHPKDFKPFTVGIRSAQTLLPPESVAVGYTGHLRLLASCEEFIERATSHRLADRNETLALPYWFVGQIWPKVQGRSF